MLRKLKAVIKRIGICEYCRDDDNESNFVDELGEHIEAGRRLGIGSADWMGKEKWWCAYSPRNNNAYAEGPWEDWVKLAQIILERENTRRNSNA